MSKASPGLWRRGQVQVVSSFPNSERGQEASGCQVQALVLAAKTVFDVMVLLLLLLPLLLLLLAVVAPTWARSQNDGQ